MWTKDASPEGFSWIDANDTAGNVFSFLRHGVDTDGKPTVVACVGNFSGTPKPDYRVGLPFAGRWREVLNTDAEIYGGSGVGNLGAVDAEQVVWHGRPASAVLQLPPSGVLWLAPEPFEGAVSRRALTQAAAATPAAEPTGPDAAEPAVSEPAAVGDAPPAPLSADVPGVAPPTSTAVAEDAVADPVPADETVAQPAGEPVLPVDFADDAGDGLEDELPDVEASGRHAQSEADDGPVAEPTGSTSTGSAAAGPDDDAERSSTVQ
jgi:1,4-alpha-glucan branching enzyme